MSTTEIESRLAYLFRGAGRAAAVSEVRTATDYPAYLDGIVQIYKGLPPDVALFIHAIIRGNVWEPI